MSTTNSASHTSVMNSYVPPKFNHHYKQGWLANPVIFQMRCASVFFIDIGFWPYKKIRGNRVRSNLL